MTKRVCRGQADFLEELASFWHLYARCVIFPGLPLPEPSPAAISLGAILSARSVVSLGFPERRVAGAVTVSEWKYLEALPRALLSPRGCPVTASEGAIVCPDHSLGTSVSPHQTSSASLDPEEAPSLVNILGNPSCALLAEGKS